MASLGTKYEKGDRQGMTAAKTFSAPPQSIVIVDGHNYRAIDPERVAMFAQMFRDKKDVPPILVALGDNGELELVDGEHRVRAALEAGVAKVALTEFSGTKRERLFAAWRFNQGSKGTATENARAFMRMRNDGYSNADIARETGASEGTVANQLLLAMSGDAVMKMVEDGDVAATPVINLARSIGPDKVLAALKDAKKTQEKAAPAKTKAAAPTPEKAGGRKLKTRKERVTAKQLDKHTAEIAEADDKRRDRTLLKMLTAHVSKMTPAFQADELESADANKLMPIRCPAGSWRDLDILQEMILEHLNKQATKE